MNALERLLALLVLAAGLIFSSGQAKSYPATSNAGTPASTNSTVCTVAPCYSYQARAGKPFLNSPYAAAQSTVGDSLIGGCGTIVTASATGVGSTARWSATCTAGSVPSTAMYNWTTRTPDAVSYSCPAGGTLSGTSCVCPEGYDDTGSSCVEAVDPAQQYCAEQSTNPAVGVSAPRPSASSGLGTYTMCYSNPYSLYACSGTMEPDICGQGPDGKWHCTGKVTFSGSAPCTGTTDPQTPEAVPAPLPSAPPPGQCPGEVNGVAVNVPCSSTVSSGTKTNETTNSSGTTQTSESRQTTCNAAGSCTTTVTTTTIVNGGSPSTSTSTTTQPKGEFCTENPGSQECGQQSSFSGTCGTSFVCQGDAVQCAQALAEQRAYCAMSTLPQEVTDTASQVLGAEMPSGLFIDGPSLSPPSAVTGSCLLTDMSIPWAYDYALEFKLSTFCPYMDTIRAFIGIFGALAFAMIVFRG